jgi:hypothetical protein
MTPEQVSKYVFSADKELRLLSLDYIVSNLEAFGNNHTLRALQACFIAGYKEAQERAHHTLEEAEARHEAYVLATEENFKRLESKLDQFADASKVMTDHNADGSKKVDEVSALLDENELVDMKLKRQYDKAYLDLVLSTPGCNPLTSFGVPPHKGDVNIIGEYVEHLEDVIAARSSKGILNNWISVRDRLPEHGAGVLVTSGGPGCTTAGYFEGSGFYNGHLEDVVITHWMPLPEPPKEDK